MGCGCGCHTTGSQTPEVSQDELSKFIYNTIRTDETDWDDASDENKKGVTTLAQKLLGEYTITSSLGVPVTNIEIPVFKPETIVP